VELGVKLGTLFSVTNGEAAGVVELGMAGAGAAVGVGVTTGVGALVTTGEVPSSNLPLLEPEVVEGSELGNVPPPPD
jgi:hypothetical protein